MSDHSPVLKLHLESSRDSQSSRNIRYLSQGDGHNIRYPLYYLAGAPAAPWMVHGPWKDRLGEYIVSVMCVKRKRETGKRRKMHEGRNYASPITQRERWDLGTSIHIGSNVAPS